MVREVALGGRLNNVASHLGRTVARARERGTTRTRSEEVLLVHRPPGLRPSSACVAAPPTNVHRELDFATIAEGLWENVGFERGVRPGFDKLEPSRDFYAPITPV